LNDFCKECQNRDVPKSIKDKFNEGFKNTFVECPTSDKKVVGCVIPINFKINWDSFCVWLEEQNDLTVKEAAEMTKLGLYNKGGTTTTW